MAVNMGAAGVTRRTALRLLLAGGAAGLVAACTPASPQTKASPTPLATSASAASTGSVATVSVVQPQPPVQAAAQPKLGGTLRLGLPGEIPSLEGHQAGYLVFDGLYHVWDRLIFELGNEDIQPMLAESWEWNADHSQLKLNLRHGVQWHTGRDFTSEDVKWNLNRAKDPKTAGGTFAGNLSAVTSIETLDQYTVLLKCDAPSPAIVHPLQLVSMIDPVTMQGPEAATRAVGTGPFTFVEWVQGDHLRLAKNKNYWRSGLPYLDEILVTPYGDAQGMTVALEAGAVDVADTPGLRDTARLQKDPRYQVVFNQNAGDYFVILVNCTTEPGTNKLLRQALNYAIDRQRILDNVMLGIGRTSDLPFNPKSPAYDEAKNHLITFDLDKAKSLLSASGLSNVELDFNYYTVPAEWGAMGQIYQADLAKIGIKLNLKPADTATIQRFSFNQSYNGLLSASSTYGRVPPPNPMYNPAVNWAGFKSDELTKLGSSMQHEVDPERQKQVYADWIDYALDQSWAMPVVSSTPRSVSSTRVHGQFYIMAEAMVLTEAWLG